MEHAEKSPSWTPENLLGFWKSFHTMRFVLRAFESTAIWGVSKAHPCRLSPLETATRVTSYQWHVNILALDVFGLAGLAASNSNVTQQSPPSMQTCIFHPGIPTLVKMVPWDAMLQILRSLGRSHQDIGPPQPKVHLINLDSPPS